MAVLPSIIAAARADAIVILPELSTIAGPLLDILVRRAACLIQPEAWKKKQQDALALLICHFGQEQINAGSGSGGGTTGASGGSGPVASVSIGKLSVSYSVPADLSAAESIYATTKWGVQFILMKRSLIIPPLAAKC